MKTTFAASIAWPIASLSLLLLAACESPTKGFVGPGCYDYRGILEPAVPTVAECAAFGMEWHAKPWPGAPAPR